MVVNYVLAVMIGGVIGAIVATLFHLIGTGSGTLKIDNSNPEKTLYNFVLDDLDDIDSKKRFILNIERTDDSHK